MHMGFLHSCPVVEEKIRERGSWDANIILPRHRRSALGRGLRLRLRLLQLKLHHVDEVVHILLLLLYRVLQSLEISANIVYF